MTVARKPTALATPEVASATVNRAGLRHLDSASRAELELLICKSNAGRDAHGPVRELQSMVGDQWGSLLVLLLHFGPLRFSVLQRIVAIMADAPISRRMLSLKLRTLRRDGVVRRVVTPTVPPQVEYSLTPMGIEFRQRMFDLVEWIDSRRGDVEAARAHFAREMLARESPEGAAD